MGSGSSRASEVLESVPKEQPVKRAPTVPRPSEIGTKVWKPDVKHAETTSEANDELQDIQDLEKTFDSLGIPRIAENNKNMSVKKSNDDEEIVENEVRVKVEDLSVQVADNPNLDSEPSLLPDDTFNDSRSIVSDSTESSPTKKHLEQPDEIDDWVYFKKEIEGFDPEKFRRANRKESEMSSDDGYSVNYFRSDHLATLHPLRVPSYDSADEQILAGIEQEFDS